MPAGLCSAASEVQPSAGFHKYRFDRTPSRVSFYVDGTWQHDMVDFLPTGPGHIVLNHWSNGDENWSRGPPEQDAVMTVSYVKAYFNSSDAARQAQFEKGYKNPFRRWHLSDTRPDDCTRPF